MRILLALPILSLAAACSDTTPDPRGVERDEVLLQVSATGRTDTRPDQARFTAGVQTIAASAALASTGNNRVMERVAAALERLGIKRDDIQTRNITLARIDYGPERGRFRPTHMVEVRVRNLDRAGEADRRHHGRRGQRAVRPQSGRGRSGSGEPLGLCPGLQGGAGRGRAYAAAAGLKVTRVLAIRDAARKRRRRPLPMAMDASVMSTPGADGGSGFAAADVQPRHQHQPSHGPRRFRLVPLSRTGAAGGASRAVAETALATLCFSSRSDLCMRAGLVCGV
jgi:uncharacterized protein YggE